MFRIGKIGIAVLAIVLFSQISYGAVRLVSESEFGVRTYSDSESTPISDDTSTSGNDNSTTTGPYPACSSAYANLESDSWCQVYNSDDPADQCVQEKCLNAKGKLITVNHCSNAFDVAEIYDEDYHISLDNVPYCRTNSLGTPGIWYFKENMMLCENNPVMDSDTTYYKELGKLVKAGDTTLKIDCAERYYDVDIKKCVAKENTVGVDYEFIMQYCYLPDEKSSMYATCPPSGYVVNYNTSAITGVSTTLYPCKTNCGILNCLAFTTKGNIYEKKCSDLIAEKEAEGWHSTLISTYTTAEAPYPCINESGVLNYVGFYCQGYDATPEECTESGGIYTETCIVPSSSSGANLEVVKCDCKNGYTLQEWCAKNHPSDISSCLTTFYGVESTKCTFEKDDSGEVITKYSEFTSIIPVCTSFTNWKYNTVISTSGGNGCQNTQTEIPVVEECRLLSSTYESEFVYACKYCKNFTDDKAVAESLCVNGTPKECYYFDNDAEKLTYSGCDCNGYQTTEEFCKANYVNEYELCIAQAKGDGKVCHSSPAPVYAPTLSGYTEDDIVRYEKIVCNSNYLSKEEWCQQNSDKIPEGYTCDDATGVGAACTIEATADDISQYKYEDYALACPETANVVTSPTDCLLDGETQAYYEICYNKADPFQKAYICKCPDTYVASCEKDYETPGGDICMFDANANGDGIYKYSGCYLSCNNKYASASSPTVYSCPEPFEGYISTIRGGSENPQKCMMASADKLYYICDCPKEFKTQEEWCKDQGINEQECKNYAGVGKVCTRDITTSDDGTPTGVLTKYADFAVYCPKDRPLYYNKEDCGYVGGEYEFSCMDENQNERVVCKCSNLYYGEEECPEIDGISSEPFGEYCDLEGNESLQYKECAVKCSAFLDKYAIAGAFKYLDSSSYTPTQIMCKNEMGDGAVLGYKTQAYCSLNNTQMYPCYCPKEYTECLSEEGQIPSKDALSCSAGGITYYSSCAPTLCTEETSTMVLVDSSGNYETDKANIQNQYGPGVSMKKCSVSDGSEKWEVSCDANTYTETCEYPYEPTAGSSWCVHGDGSTLMKNGTKYYRNGSCKVLQTLGECGKNIIVNGNTVSSPYTILTVSSESECKSKYGPGASVQLCEYGADQGYKRAYNCYYDSSKFKYTTSNCGVRHDLSGDYIILNGKKYYDECKCSSAYQYHKYNCGGMLSGTACQQEITSDIASSDNIPSNMVGSTLPFYPYCECSADYTEVCDEDGSGRYKGVGQECNGKYKSCECIPDPLPENWADNYYGCPGGKKPTGVWKDNGCGLKYYQCSVIECSWEYTEMCEAPLLPVGQPCQDNQGNVGGYKACTCPTDYKICPASQVGEGEPCNLKGVSYYKSCKTQDACDTFATETCTGPLQIGVNPCVRDNTTYYEKCVCANGYTEVCGDGEVGVGNYCEINGVKYYKECAKPEDNMCTSGHVTACDTNQISYSPCVGLDEEGKQIVKYLCKCPSNWFTSSTCSEGTLEGERCSQKDYLGNVTEYYSKCSVTSSCSTYQEASYKVCNESQTGDGESCVSTLSDGSTVTKYATCVDSNNCVATGFKYSCSGYDTSALGEYCVDANGNKLYKSCPCPSSYVPCSGYNTSKGTKCTPVQADGSLGTPVYSSCRCDRSKYKYTCTPEESGNMGVVAPSTPNYCELTETVTETTTDEQGNPVTSEVEKSVKYYSSCECASDYKYTCSSQSTGEVVPAEYENDYCQINSTKFYKGCDCSEDYAFTSAQCDSQGAVVDTSGGYCVIKGQVSNATRETNTNLYKSCTCKPGYKECTDEKYDQTEVKGCTIDADKTLYPQCKCNDTYQYTCVKSGNNQGIEKGLDVCLEITVDNNGIAHSTEKYSSCRCGLEYIYTCDSTAYDQSSELYCAITDETGTETRRYKNCVCNSLYYNTLSPALYSDDQESYCTRLGLSVNSSVSEPFCEPLKGGVTTTVKYPHYNICM